MRFYQKLYDVLRMAGISLVPMPIPVPIFFKLYALRTRLGSQLREQRYIVEMFSVTFTLLCLSLHMCRVVSPLRLHLPVFILQCVVYGSLCTHTVYMYNNSVEPPIVDPP